MTVQQPAPMAPERLKLFEEEMAAWQKVEVWLGPGVNSPENAEKHSAEAVRKYEFRQGEEFEGLLKVWRNCIEGLEG